MAVVRGDYGAETGKKCTKTHCLSERIGGVKKKQYLCSRFREDSMLSGAVVQLVRIPACHAVGREFESRPHRINRR